MVVSAPLNHRGVIRTLSGAETDASIRHSTPGQLPIANRIQDLTLAHPA